MLLVCCGMPRSASTLQFNIAWKTITQGGMGDRLEWRSSADWQKAGAEIEELARSDKVHVAKMHFPPGTIRECAESSDRIHFVYVHRDLRDVIASLRIKFDFSTSHAIGRVRDALETERWLANGPKGRVLVQEYPLLLHELPRAVDEVAAFVGADLSMQQRQAIVDELGIDSAYEKSRQKVVPFEHLRRRLGRLLGLKTVFADENLMLHPNHVSAHKGEIGIWKSALSDSDLRLIEATFGERLHKGFNV